jgi:hypothetical protein
LWIVVRAVQLVFRFRDVIRDTVLRGIANESFTTQMHGQSPEHATGQNEVVLTEDLWSCAAAARDDFLRFARMRAPPRVATALRKGRLVPVSLMKKTVLLLAVGFLAVLPAAARAAAITFSASGTSTTGTALKASATFTVDTTANRLVVTLTNTAMSDVLSPSDVLTAVFFDVSNGLSFTPSTATIATGSAAYTGTTLTNSAGTAVGGEWEYLNNLSGAPHTAKEGISSAGMGLFGNANFSGPNLSGPTAVDGVQYGLSSAGDNLSTGNSGVTTVPLIKDSVIFKLVFPCSTNCAAGTNASTFDPSTSIFNVSFQYGTALTEANLTPGPIPEPGTCVLFATGLLAVSRRLRSRKRRTTSSTAY